MKNSDDATDMTMIASINLHHRKRYLIENLQRLADDEQDGNQKADDRDDNRIVARQKRNQDAENT